MNGTAALVAAVAALAFPAPASAFTGVRQIGETIRVTSDSGENNVVFLELADTLDGITVEDGRGIISTPPCTNVNPFKAFCGISEPAAVEVELNDGNDVFVPGLRILGVSVLNLKPPRTRISGGPGRDRLFGLLGSDTLIGGPGRDRLYGLYGSDTMSGGSGDDLLEGGGSLLDGTNGRDGFFGGPGADKVRARDSTRDLRIDCGPGRDKLSRDRFDPKPRRCP
jgi:hypothetical protein